MTRPIAHNRARPRPHERTECDSERIERQLRSAMCCRTPDRTWMTDEQANGYWANAVRACEEGRCS